jgi:hypothetical protein
MTPALFGMVQIPPVFFVLFFLFVLIALLGAVLFLVFVVRSVVRQVRRYHTPPASTHLEQRTGRTSA